LFFQPEQYFSLTTNQPEQCFGLFFSEANRAMQEGYAGTTPEQYFSQKV